MTALRPLALLLLCAAAPCPAGQPAYWFELFFGRTSVSDSDWQQFVDTDITEAFPDGFTILNADGAWRAPGAARTLHEPSNVLLIAVPRAQAPLSRVNRLIAIYKQRFHQKSVGLTVQETCASF